MWFDNRRVSDIEPQQIRDVINTAKEDQWLDFKQQPYQKDDDEGKFEMLKDVTAMANAEGGYILLGVGERNGIAAGFCTIHEPEKVTKSIEYSCLQYIDPRIPGLEVEILRRVKDALLYRRFEEGIFELKGKRGYELTIVDVLDGHVREIEGNVVYAKYLINGEEHQAAFDIDLFQKAGADFQGARVRFLTLKTDDESTPYDLRIELKGEQTLNKNTRDVQEKLDRLEQFDNFEEVRQ